MRLYIKDEYFEAIRSGEKKIDFREAHITFANKDTKELLDVPIIKAYLITHEELPKNLQNKAYLKGKWFIAFDLGKVKQ